MQQYRRQHCPIPRLDPDQLLPAGLQALCLCLCLCLQQFALVYKPGPQAAVAVAGWRAGMVCVTMRPKDAAAGDEPVSNARSAWSLSEHARRIDSFKRLLGRSNSNLEPSGWDLKQGSQAVEGVPLRADDQPASDDQQHLAGGHIQLQLVQPQQQSVQAVQQGMQQQQQAGAGVMPAQHHQQDVFEQEVLLAGPHSATAASGRAVGVHHRHLGLLPADDTSSIQHTAANLWPYGEQQQQQHEQQGHQLSQYGQSRRPS